MSTNAHSLPNQTPVLIVGAGPAGLTLALTLQRAGVPYLLVESKTKPREYSKAATLWPRTREILDLLGVVDRWQDQVVPWTSASLFFGDEQRHLDFPPAKSPYPYPVLVGQDVTEHCLEEGLRAAGGQVWRGITVEAVDLHADGAHVRYQTAEGQAGTIEAAWVVGCEGSRSVVREAAGIVRHGSQNPGIQIVQGDVFVSGPLTLEPGRGYIWTGKGPSSILLFQIDVAGHYRVVVTIVDEGQTGTPTLEELQNPAQHYVPGLHLHDPVWLSRYRTQHLLADHYRAGRALLCGDAAHVWVPIGGQGMNIAMHDAFDLGWKLAGVVGGTLAEATLDTYQTERRPVGKQVIEDTERDYAIIVKQETLGDRLLQHVAPYLLRLKPVVRNVINELDELNTRYATGPLVQDHTSGGIPAGERAPDAWVNEDGNSIRLFDLYRAGQWLLLGCAPEADADLYQALVATASHFHLAAALVLPQPPTLEQTQQFVASGARVLLDQPGLVSAAFGLSTATMLAIRPDGVIGFRGPLAAAPKLAAYLQQLLPLAGTT